MRILRTLFMCFACLLAACQASATVEPTLLPPTHTQQAFTFTPLPPTATQLPPTAAQPPTDTAYPPDTPVPPDTEYPPSPTVEPSPTPVQGGGSLPVQPVEVITDGLGVPMVLIPAGPFVMGSDEVLNAPPHTVFLDDYYIDMYEVTNALYASFLNDIGNQEEDGVFWLDTLSEFGHLHMVDSVWVPDEGFTDHPNVEVTWYGAKAFCQWRGARLPTEAEWEKAARGTDERTFPWGEEINCEVTNYRSCGFGVSLPIGSYPGGVSPYGVHDMAGNVAEWTADWYAADYYLKSPSENPPGPSKGETMASRGGSWYSNSTFLRTFHRNNEFSPRRTLRNVGFRCVVSSP